MKKVVLEMSALELSRKIREQEYSVEEVVNAYMDRISKMEPKLHSFLHIEKEQIAARVTEVEDGIRRGRYAGVLAGVPVAIKDNICTKGLQTTCASKMLENFVPAYNAEVIRRLEAAGMIILGKTNMDEFAMGSTTETSAYGVTRNPWNEEHVPGGSSGGSCAAVAAGETPLALGTDTGGSIRQPASYCGVVGMKPTYGSVSRYGLIAYASSMDQIGPIARSVEECRALYDVIAGRDEKDSTSVAVEQTCHEMQQVRLAIPREYMAGVDEEVRMGIDAAVELLQRNGVTVEYISMPMTEYAVQAYYMIACAEASSNLARFDGVKYGYRSEDAKGLHKMYRQSRTEGFGEEVKRRIMVGSYALSEGFYDAYYLKALKVKALIKEEFDRVFKEYDCILTPVSPTTAPRLGESLSHPLEMYRKDMCTVAVNLAGLPAISIPCGFDGKGLPIGLQLIGNSFTESKLFGMAAMYEKLRGNMVNAGESMDRKVGR